MYPVKNEFMRTCRSCINRRYGLHLHSKDCYYLQYPAQCKDCGEVRNIVAGLTVPARVKAWFHSTFDALHG